MPITFIEIEKQKTWRISILFFVLLLMYFCIAMTLIQGFLFLFPVHFIKTGSLFIWNHPSYLLTIAGISLVLAAIHFWFSAFNAVRSVMNSLGATPPDTEDEIHKRLMNIMDEIHVVTGTVKKIKCMVIPSLSMNAIAVADLKGNSAIAITEGLLSRLTRSQTEVVLAHEAYHILSGDCMETTVATSLFGMYAAMLDKLQSIGDEDRSGLHPAFFLFWILVKISQMLSMFISREREYRADAASVRMTRDPLSMAEALYQLSRNWRGSGLIGSGLEMLCIINPQATERDESEGFWADLMSTHPPIRKRIEILLRMVHMSIKELDAKASSKSETTNMSNASEPLHYALNPKHQWQGPYSLAELTTLPWLSPLTWVSREPGRQIERASENASINTLFANHLKQTSGETSAFLCPSCRQSLLRVPYEKTKVFQCNFCGGILVEDIKIPRLIIRRERNYTERIKSLAQAVIADNQKRIALKILKNTDIKTKHLIACPKCKNPMFRTFYSLAYLIEIDRCNLCNLTWFDTDELEMLQCLIENKITVRINL